MAFMKEENQKRNLEEIRPKQLNDFLVEFMIFFRRKDRDEFKPLSLRGLFSSFNRPLKACKYPMIVMEDLEFVQTRKALEARSKQLNKERKSNKPNAAEAKTDGEVSILNMFSENLLWITSAEAFLSSLWTSFIRIGRLRQAPKNDLGRCSTYQSCGRK